MDYATYIHRNGCDFGHFTCCDHVNNTMLEEYASANCGVSDVCGYVADAVSAPIAIVAFVMVFLFFMGGYEWKRRRTRDDGYTDIGESSARNARLAEIAAHLSSADAIKSRSKHEINYLFKRDRFVDVFTYIPPDFLKFIYGRELEVAIGQRPQDILIWAAKNGYLDMVKVLRARFRWPHNAFYDLVGAEMQKYAYDTGCYIPRTVKQFY